MQQERGELRRKFFLQHTLAAHQEADNTEMRIHNHATETRRRFSTTRAGIQDWAEAPNSKLPVNSASHPSERHTRRRVQTTKNTNHTK